MPSPDARPDLVLLGVFGAAHGVRGEVRLKSYTGVPQAIASYGVLTTEAGKTYELTSVRALKDDMLVARVKGVGDRNAAEALTNVRLYVPRERLGEADTAEDEFFHADLVGLRVETADGTPFGTVVALHDFGAGDMIEITPAAGGRTMLLAFTKAVVPVVDVSGGRIVVAPPAEVEGEPERRAATKSSTPSASSEPPSDPSQPPRRRGLKTT